ncbi:hypothetical protein ABK040_000660 [Willaertia magna]
MLSPSNQFHHHHHHHSDGLSSIPDERKLSTSSSGSNGSNERKDSISITIPQLLTDSNITPNILVIDDDPVTRRTIQKLLSNLGYKSKTASGGKEALNLLLRDEEDPFHCLLVDVLMPEMDGFSFMKVLKQAVNREIPCIMMSGSEDPETVAKSFQYGAEDFLPKPIREEILRARIQAVLAYRDRKIKEKFYIKKIHEEQRLRNQLQHIERKNEEELLAFKQKVNESIETPLQLIMSTVTDIMNGNLDREQTKLALISVMKSLSSSNLYRPAFLDYMKTAEMDENTRQWLVDQYTKGFDDYSLRKRTDRSSSTDSNASTGSQTAVPNITHKNSIVEVLPFDIDNYKPSVDVSTMNYDAFNFTYDELKMHVIYFFKSLNLFDEFNFSPYKLWNFIGELRKKYRMNYYHNFRHCCDVTQFIYMFLNSEKISTFLSPVEKFAMLVSGLCHDIDHPGVNNNFLVMTEDELAYRYNDKSVLENYHACSGFRTMLKESYNILEGMTEEQYREFRKIMINTILATDMSNHFSILSFFESRIGTGRLSNENQEDRIILMKMLMKCSDISNMSRPFEIAKKWACACIHEFFNQGDLERKKGLPISPLMDRYTLDFPKSQIDFGNFIVSPLFKQLAIAYKELVPLYETVLNNINQWKQLFDEEQQKHITYSPFPFEVCEGSVIFNDTLVVKPKEVIMEEITKSIDSNPPKEQEVPKQPSEPIVVASSSSTSVKDATPTISASPTTNESPTSTTSNASSISSKSSNSIEKISPLTRLDKMDGDNLPIVNLIIPLIILIISVIIYFLFA